MPSSRSPRLQAELERMSAERSAAERQVARTYRWALVRACVECLAGCALGAVCMGYAMHTTDRATGEIFWWGGLVVGYTCITLSLIGAYHRGEERGDW